MKKLFDVATIDFSLLLVESWQIGYTQEMKRQLGIYLPSLLFFRTKAGINILRPLEDQQRFVHYIAQRIKNNPSYLSSRLRRFNQYLNQLEQLEKMKGKRGIYKSPKRLLPLRSGGVRLGLINRGRPDNERVAIGAYTSKLFNLTAKILPMYVVVHWLYRVPSLKKYINFKTDKARLRSEGYYDRVDTVFKKIYDKVLKNKSHLKNFFKVIRYEEFKNLILKDSYPDFDELKQRALNYFLFQKTFLFGKLSFKELAKAHRFEYHQNSISQFKTKKIIRGRTAFWGKVKGRVKIVEGKEELGKIKRGDILVTPMTSPDFIPAIKRAAALITDYGGMMSHMAIAARELKKPCIVGTKFATQVLKDGDWVEVDADRGLVKLLKRDTI